jgi:hypothetical protein
MTKEHCFKSFEQCLKFVWLLAWTARVKIEYCAVTCRLFVCKPFKVIYNVVFFWTYWGLKGTKQHYSSSVCDYCTDSDILYAVLEFTSVIPAYHYRLSLLPQHRYRTWCVCLRWLMTEHGCPGSGVTRGEIPICWVSYQSRETYTEVTNVEFRAQCEYIQLFLISMEVYRVETESPWCNW